MLDVSLTIVVSIVISVCAWALYKTLSINTTQTNC